MRDLLRRLLRQRKAAVGGSILLGFIVLALIGPWLVMDPTELVGRPHQPPSSAHWFGTTGQGQDVLAQTVVGARETLAIGFAVGALVTLMGALIGVTSGYLGRRVDDVLTLTTNVFLVIPGLPLAIVLGAYLPSGPFRMVVVLSLAGWAWNARVFRAEAMALRNRDFVSAAFVAGESRSRIVVRELLPNMASLLGSSFIGNTLYAVGAQVGLEFLGLGDVGAVTWGTNLYWAGNDAALLTRSWWVFVPTGLCIALVGFSLTLLSSAIDEVTNPALKAPPVATTAVRSARSSSADAAPPPGALLSIRDVCIEYATERGPARVVDSVSFDIAPGEVFGLAGESGSGKSTLGYALLRLLPPAASITQGRIILDGTDVTALDETALRAYRWSQVSMVFQSAMSALNPVLTLGDQFHDTLAAHGRTTRAAAHARARELLAMVGLAPQWVDAWPHQLSGGMRQRVGIALALALEPRLVVMDEPTTALDVVVQKELLQRVLELKQRLGFAVLFITHDLPLLLALSDRVGVLQGGKLVEVDTAERLRTEARHPYTRLLLSSFPHLSAADAQVPADVTLASSERAPPQAAAQGGGR
ncbi:putative oligopeptide/dipeptide ABC transporter, permease/ATP-binding protein [Myxococcus xanthus DK 1622]|uniref:Oligopeptide/dipeptide ABC transporter, permease/ATP-binding protein n=1 Tax=Myxococcus xanthus (strain DK1622) TaxID=246197 RepID=Q1CY48_MYXXD|nr:MULTISPECIES: dipeptide/oligopeptide/nickel ABC transporter permease/ATP-binding protein [Myxococcus]ABF91133.1 putative oligopeptide/dipeptide ABC transporter, permease/ATP-binding protein [Myxococcus xanthus DK 1622]NOJ56843.1 dipeptide/oligopeptide/nickel ABC transporter permease/ATP-binding protein [Myxococcus xanthus]QPM78883.1 dipeptide/oligopeptide/nickel ABC transporter permease/ATP-binding protein [Myxococcus xanthus]QVW67953.1 dipeptide/oligopeptide/nickel ABC transporter permease/